MPNVNRLTLDEFVAACPRELELFAASTHLHQAEGTEGFVGDAYQRRTLADWFAEVTAYLEYTELQEALENDRRANPERRSINRR